MGSTDIVRRFVFTFFKDASDIIGGLLSKKLIYNKQLMNLANWRTFFMRTAVKKI